MILRKIGDVVNVLIFVCEVFALHAIDSNVLEGLSARLKRIGYYTLRLVFYRITHINLLVI